MAIHEDELSRFLEKKLLEIASVMMTYYDCCMMVDDVCKAYPDGGNLCCHNGQFGPGLCPFWQNGCQYQNADCKLSLCETALKTTDPKCAEGLRLLQEFGRLFGITRPLFNGDRYTRGADKNKHE